MTRRRAILLASVTVALLLLITSVAFGEFRGSDAFSGGFTDVPNLGGMADWHPLSAYSLDWHIDTSPDHPSGWVANSAQGFANLLWTLSSWIISTILTMLAWCLSQDFLTGKGGALDTMSRAVARIRNGTLGGPWLETAIVGLGLWGIWRGFTQRRFTEAFVGIASSILIVAVLLVVVNRPQETIGKVASMTNEATGSFLTLGNPGSVEDGTKRLSNRVFEQGIYKPWAFLNFGGLETCTSNTQKDDDGFWIPVAPSYEGAKTCRDVLRERNSQGGYAAKFLAFPPGTPGRNKVYDAIKDGETPDGARDGSTLCMIDPGTGECPKDPLAGWKVDKHDSPAVDMMQEGGTYQRLAMTIGVFVMAIGMALVLGALGLGMLLAQAFVLVLFMFLPLILLAALIPGWGHNIVRKWAGKLGVMLVIKALYALTLAIIVEVSAAIYGTASEKGFIPALMFLLIFYWGLFLYRHKITGALGVNHSYDKHAHKQVHRYTRKAADMVASPVKMTAAAGVASGAAIGGAATPVIARGARSATTKLKGAVGIPGGNGRDGQVETDHANGDSRATGRGSVPMDAYTFKARPAEPQVPNGHRPAPRDTGVVHGPLDMPEQDAHDRQQAKRQQAGLSTPLPPVRTPVPPRAFDSRLPDGPEPYEFRARPASPPVKARGRS